MIGLVADDLTGASDAAVQFTRAGLAARVLFEISPRDLPRADVDAFAIDTDSRALPAGAAYARVRLVADCLRRLAPRHVYKKIDSTLRGNVGAEIEAMLDALGVPLAIIAPAFPSLGRSTRQGRQYVCGIAVEETEAARDPRAPVNDSNVARVLRAQSRRGAGLVPLDCVADGPDAIRRCIDEQTARDVSLVVCDATTDAHLRAVVDSSLHRRDVLWVGSAGLAEQLATRLEPSGACLGRVPLEAAATGPVLLVCGSLSATTRRQAATFAAAEGVVSVELDPRAVVGRGDAGRAELERCERALAAALEQGFDCALLLAAGERHAAVASAEAASDIAGALGRLGALGVREHALGGVILTGGDTARAVCRALAVTGIDLFGEVEPGVPVGRLLGGVELPVVTKAGGFGSDQVLLHARQRLRDLAQTTQ